MSDGDYSCGSGCFDTWKRVMFFVWGTVGDVVPAVALALRLEKEAKKVAIFCTPPSSELVCKYGVKCYPSRENVREFAENVFGQVDPSERGVLGAYRSMVKKQAYISHPAFLELQKEDIARGLEAAQEFEPDVSVGRSCQETQFHKLAFPVFRLLKC
uniref:Glycosyltransferase family 28 N-terminal domain-containing protein n=1 Tax=Tetraselmis sp. GSL018 TaxID=582737 RepID=A0A061S789_9CHLO|eukprot:CAMPEP_0177601608 /NCGR_PEP_ID=MMETSP0419_2-20121207/14365_1 /TAXON_ID=582737 /ORGANISM="Tetraselmis sp., Strain GSL018" /LENGTH=156 /DNA_ID=CAMNT_0019094915 /DNA_START=346 /DNA_END=816 /DNA_ORIENTATION=-